jgi:hypothetical protein
VKATYEASVTVHKHIPLQSFIMLRKMPSAVVCTRTDLRLQVPDAELVVVMGAVAKSNAVAKNGTRNFKFAQQVPIPSYLIALAAGALEFHPIGNGDRCGVWSEHVRLTSFPAYSLLVR